MSRSVIHKIGIGFLVGFLLPFAYLWVLVWSIFHPRAVWKQFKKDYFGGKI